TGRGDYRARIRPASGPCTAASAAFKAVRRDRVELVDVRPVRAVAARDRLRLAVARVDDVVAGASQDRVVARPPGDLIAAVVAVQGVVVRAAVDRVTAAAAVKLVALAVAEQLIRSAPAADDLDVRGDAIALTGLPVVGG